MSGTLNSLVALPVISILPSVHNAILAVATNRLCLKLAAALGSGSSYSLEAIDVGHVWDNI